MYARPNDDDARHTKDGPHCDPTIATHCEHQHGDHFNVVGINTAVKMETSSVSSDVSFEIDIWRGAKTVRSQIIYVGDNFWPQGRLNY